MIKGKLVFWIEWKWKLFAFSFLYIMFWHLKNCSGWGETALAEASQFLFFFFFFFLMIVDLQCCVSFWYTAKWFSYMCVCVCVCVCVCACGWKRKVRKTAENVQKTKIMASTPITSWQIDGDKVETVTDFIFLGSKITADSNCSHEIKRHFSLEGKLWQT